MTERGKCHRAIREQHCRDGAYLGGVANVRIFSENGGDCTVINPWADTAVSLFRNGASAETRNGARLTFPTEPGETITLAPGKPAGE